MNRQGAVLQHQVRHEPASVHLLGLQCRQSRGLMVVLNLLATLHDSTPSCPVVHQYF